MIKTSNLITENNNTSTYIDIEYLFNTYYARLCYFAYKLVKNQAAAKDLAQDVFLKHWHKRNEYSSELAIKNFLYLSLRNTCLNYIRHDSIEKKYAETLADDTSEEENGLSYLIKAEALAAIHNAIENLPIGCKTVLKLAYFEGLKNEQIANEMGVSINTIKTQKQRALKLLRLKLPNSAYLLIAFLPS